MRQRKYDPDKWTIVKISGGWRARCPEAWYADYGACLCRTFRTQQSAITYIDAMRPS